MLDLLMAMSSDAILIFNESGHIIHANQGAANLFGCTVDQLEKCKLSSLIPRRYQKKHRQFVRSLIDVDKTGRKMGEYHEIYVQHKNGDEFPVEVAIGKTELEGAPVLAAVLRNVTAQKETDEFLRSLANLPIENPNPVFRIKSNGQILFANESAKQLLASIGLSDLVLAPRELLKQVQNVLKEDSQIVTLIPFNQRIYSCIVSPVKSKGYVNVYALDVTEREVEKSKLALSDDILNSIGNLVLVANSNAQIVYVSPSVKNIIGYEPEELLGDGWWEMERISGGDVETEKGYIRWAAAGLSTTDSKPYEHRVRHKDGFWRWMMLADTKGPQDLIIGIGTDITQLKQTEEALMESEARYRRAISAIDAVPYNLDYSTNQYVFIGEEIERITGYTRDELTPAKFSDLIQEAVMCGKFSGLTSVEATNQVRDGDAQGIWQCDFRILTKSGESRWFSDTSIQNTNSEGKVIGAVGILQDITSRKLVETQLREYADEIHNSNIALAEARDEALEASYVKSAFLATMSHEIRTPMNAILGMTELLLDTQLDKEQREFAQVVESSTHHLLDILNDILDFSKIEAGKLAIRPAPFKPAELIRETLNLFLSRANEKNISVSVDLSEKIPEFLQGDAGRIRQVLHNFISNAIKFTGLNGRISLTVSGTAINSNIFILGLTVEDTGIGIPDSLKNDIFEPFTQADFSNTRKYGGTGLGLAISKRLVELMDGEIGFDSVENQGSKFWFSVPLSQNSGQPATQISTQFQYPDYSKCKPVLIVEDNLVNRDLITMQLHRLGVHTKHASNGREAVELWQMTPDDYSLILMDLHMPIMDGLTATGLIRQKETSSKNHIPIIALTADVTEGGREKCFQSGLDDFISKPVALTDINNLLSKWLERRL